jgi:hypothetical protein
MPELTVAIFQGIYIEYLRNEFRHPTAVNSAQQQKQAAEVMRLVRGANTARNDASRVCSGLAQGRTCR